MKPSPKTFIYTLLIFIIGGFLLASPLIIGFGKTGKNTRVLGKDYSLLNKQQIITRLSTDFQLPSSLKLQYDNRNFDLELASISAQIDKNKVANNLLFRRLNQGLSNYINAFFYPKSFNLDISYDESQLDKYLADISSQINRPFVPFELQLSVNTSNKKTISINKGELGIEMDTLVLKQDLNSRLSGWQLDVPINIPVKYLGNLPNSDQISQTESKANNLIGKSLTLTGASQEVIVDDKTLISWLTFDDRFDTKKITDFIKGIGQSLRRDPINAVFRVDNGKVLEFRPAVTGLTVDETALIAQLPVSVNQLLTSGTATTTVAVPVITTDPAIKTGDANNLGIKELLGSGTSTFKHSNDTRNFNIEKGSSIVNSILVAPNETFSFIKNLGEVTLDTGFKKAYIIRQGKTELDVGGGICQVSTTLFRAMLNAGMDITQRQAHAYRVSYYEEDSLPGYDATVFIPNPDLKFVNDTGNYVLIQNTFDLKNRRLTYEIYGTSDGRTVNISNYRRWDAAPAPPDVNIDDPTLPLGKVVQDEHAIPGLKTAFDWQVVKNGQIIHQKTFQSVYVPWAAVFRHGTKQP
jgi:vancomycin resistance protein YoaR